MPEKAKCKKLQLIPVPTHSTGSMDTQKLLMIPNSNNSKFKLVNDLTDMVINSDSQTNNTCGISSFPYEQHIPDFHNISDTSLQQGKMRHPYSSVNTQSGGHKQSGVPDIASDSIMGTRNTCDNQECYQQPQGSGTSEVTSQSENINENINEQVNERITEHINEHINEYINPLAGHPASLEHNGPNPSVASQCPVNHPESLLPQPGASKTPQCFFGTEAKGYTRPPDWPTINEHIRQSAPTELQSEYIKIYDAVRASRQPNFIQCRIPLPHKFNIDNWRKYINDTNYQDESLLDLIQFGFPLDFNAIDPPVSTFTNHKSARDYPDHVTEYLNTQVQNQSMLGPFDQIPFSPWSQINPMMTKEKKHSSARRTIVDLSFPHGASVNSGTPSDTYLEVQYKLALPTVDMLVDKMCVAGKNCLIWKKDLKSAFRQLRVDPLDYPLLCLQHNSQFYADLAYPFGARNGSLCMQRCMDAVQHFMVSEGHSVDIFIDDSMGIDIPHKATAAFVRQGQLFKELGMEEATEKDCPPATKQICLGIQLDSESMTKSVPPDKLSDITQELIKWSQKTSASKNELQQLLGRLLFIAKCVNGARLFLNRILDLMRQAPHTGVIPLSPGCLQDIAWFLEFCPFYNGVNVIQPKPLDSHEQIECDACLTGLGGLFSAEYYHQEIPPQIQKLNLPIHNLECYNILIALRVWASQLRGRAVTIMCDNAASVSVLQSARGRDPFLLACARQIWLISSVNDITIHPRHKPGEQMDKADTLSRAHLGSKYSHKLKAITRDKKRIHLSPGLLALPY